MKLTYIAWEACSGATKIYFFLQLHSLLLNTVTLCERELVMQVVLMNERCTIFIQFGGS